MMVEIGAAAGDVYRFLEAHGPATVTQISKGTGRKPADVNAAIGWLAREDKLAGEARGRTVRWSIGTC
jgi:hypothetical protein